MLFPLPQWSQFCISCFESPHFTMFSSLAKWKFLVSLEAQLFHVIFFWKPSYESMFLLKQTRGRMFWLEQTCGVFLEAAWKKGM